MPRYRRSPRPVAPKDRYPSFSAPARPAPEGAGPCSARDRCRAFAAPRRGRACRLLAPFLPTQIFGAGCVVRDVFPQFREARRCALGFQLLADVLGVLPLHASSRSTLPVAGRDGGERSLEDLLQSIGHAKRSGLIVRRTEGPQPLSAGLLGAACCSLVRAPNARLSL